MEPSICAIAALVKYLFSNPTILLGQTNKLFPGKSQYYRFIKGLRQALLANKKEIEKLGGDIEKIASHSIQKGSATLCACGVTVSPPMASICLRAGWSMGTIKDRYLHYEKAGDHYFGCTVAGISALSINFAVSPAYFEFDGDDDKKEFEKLMNDFTGGTVNSNLLHLLQFLYATLLFHRDFLRQTMYPKNALFACPIFSNIPNKF